MEGLMAFRILGPTKIKAGAHNHSHLDMPSLFDGVSVIRYLCPTLLLGQIHRAPLPCYLLDSLFSPEKLRDVKSSTGPRPLGFSGLDQMDSTPFLYVKVWAILPCVSIGKAARA